MQPSAFFPYNIILNCRCYCGVLLSAFLPPKVQIMSAGRIPNARLNDLYGIVPTQGRRLLDGGVYGILFNLDGVAIKPFATKPEAKFSDVEITSCTIKHVESAPVHVVSLRTGNDDKATTGLQGELWNVFEFADGQKYAGTPVTDLLILLAEMTTPGPKGVPELVALRKNGGFKKTFSINDDLVKFAAGEVTFQSLIKGKLKCNVDFMNHTMKGVIGLFLQGGDNVLVKDVTITGVSNKGKLDFVPQCKANDPLFKTYDGASARGVAVVASTDVKLKNVKIIGVTSTYGAASGVDVFNGSKNVCISDVTLLRIGGKSVAGGALPKCY